MIPRLGPRTLVVATCAMAVLLAALAVLEVRWAGQVGRGEGERLKRDLEAAASRIADDLDREVSRAFIAFLPARASDQPIEQRLAEGWRRWNATALAPELVAAVYAVTAHARGGPSSLWRVDAESAGLEPVPWPPELARLIERLAAERGRGGVPRPGSREVVLPQLPGLLLVSPPRPPWARAAREDGSEEQTRAVIVAFDRGVLTAELLPDLLDTHLGPEPRQTEVLIVARSRGREVVYSTREAAASARGEGDVRRPLFSLRLFPDLRAQGFQSFFDDPEIRHRVEGARRHGAGQPSPGRMPYAGAEGAAWTLVLTRHEGSVEAAVAKLRRRNLGIGLGVVALLGGTAALLLVSARHVQRLARREMELVAGITHELRTPLAAIGSAADNLADGVVRDPVQIRRYGSLIRGETHRLGALVAQVLDFAGMAASRRRARPPEPVDVGAILDRVLDDLRFLITEKAVVVERVQEADLPRAIADPEALRRALDNVVGNALKYGESGRWVGIEAGLVSTSGRIGGRAGRSRAGRASRGAHGSARSLAGESRVAVRVRDRGPGIPRAERRRIFEPFYRGDAAARHLHGTGLGLAVTRSMLEGFGGTIDVEESEPGRGTTFLLTLPVAPATADRRDVEPSPSAAAEPSRT
ncbi:MAG TPA: HAMP domain-containing sensor histidine kinase [Thermoanaerobaculia bacterium]|nr:HAMP domain-containing sensor histidine kinase [Thermoanaerobaculia bacterium]